jgi:8-oxo-dGTP pyrophosphatase MutT (NUDIX family)
MDLPTKQLVAPALERHWDIAQIQARLERFTPTTHPPQHALRPSAVLVPLLQTESGVEVVFTLRREDLGSHPGQVSFPGGRVDPGDQSTWHTATRECEEEIGIPRAAIQPIGRLSDFPVITNFLISPWVGEVDPDLPFRPNPSEVEEVFAIPLRQLARPEYHRVVRFGRSGHEGPVHFFHGGPHIVWGATAGILWELLDVLGYCSDTSNA